jgi:hypothetical protein
MRRSHKAFATSVVALSFALGSMSGALANPKAPTNGGNGAGKSGQCTGAQNDRPASCKSQGGPGNRP